MYQYIQPILLGLTLLFLLYDRFFKPEANTDKELALIKEGCRLRHESIDENLILIKENHLQHIEKTMKDISDRLIRIETKLEK